MVAQNQNELAKYPPAESAKEINLQTGSDLNLSQKEKQDPNNPEDLTKTSRTVSLQAVLIIISLIIISGVLVFLIVYFRHDYLTKNDETYDLIKLSSSSALCLDGSPAAYHLSQGGGPSKILVYFAGGGWCFDETEQKMIQACYQRSFTELGTSNSLSQTTTIPEGIMSKDEKNYFKDWKKVYLYYCDGTGHQGYRKDPIEYKGTKLYFRGYNNTVERLEDVENRIGIFTKAEKVVINGGSAGGLAVATWANYLAGKMQKGKLWTVTDAGLFYDSMNINTKKYAYKEKFATMMKISNAEIDPPLPECIAKFPDAKQNCMLAQNIYQHITTPLFVVQSLYDIWSVSQIIGATCILDSIKSCGSEEMTAIEENRQNITKVMQKVAQNKANGVWGFSCVKHQILTLAQYTDLDFQVNQQSGYTALKAVSEWLQNPNQNNVHMDLAPWPNNVPCA